MNGTEGVAVADGERVSVGDKVGVGKNGRVDNLRGVGVTDAVGGYFVDCSAGVRWLLQPSNIKAMNHKRNTLGFFILSFVSLPNHE